MSNRKHRRAPCSQSASSEALAAPKDRAAKPLMRGLWEGALLFTLVIAGTYTFTGDLKFNELSLHPFWIPVILISAHYGTYSGLAAVLMAVMLNFALDWPVQGVHEEYFAYLGRLWAEPILWMSASLVLGELRMQHLGELKALDDRSREAENQRHIIAAFCNDLQAENRRLEHQLAVGAFEFMREHLQQLARLEASDLQELERKAADLIRDVFPKAVLSLWRVDKSKLDIPNAPKKRCISLHRALIIEQKQLNALNEVDAELLNGLARLAVPVSLPDGEPIGALAVVDLDTLSLDGEAPIYLSLLAHQAGIALAACGGSGHPVRPVKKSTAVSSYRNWQQDQKHEAS